MRSRKLLQKTLDLLGVTREELEHLVECERCSDPFDGETGYYCDEYARRFWGYERPKSAPAGPQPSMPAEFQRLWSEEILRQAAPVLRFEQFDQDAIRNQLGGDGSGY